MLRILMGLVALGLLAIPAQAADYYYGGESYAGVPYGTHFHRLPVCGEAKVLAKVTNKFAYYDAHVIGSGLVIADIGDIRETKVSVNGPSPIPRRYCHATAYSLQRQAVRVGLSDRIPGRLRFDPLERAVLPARL